MDVICISFFKYVCLYFPNYIARYLEEKNNMLFIFFGLYHKAEHMVNTQCQLNIVNDYVFMLIFKRANFLLRALLYFSLPLTLQEDNINGCLQVLLLTFPYELKNECRSLVHLIKETALSLIERKFGSSKTLIFLLIFSTGCQSSSPICP